jgi:hypothetical protein
LDEAGVRETDAEVIVATEEEVDHEVEFLSGTEGELRPELLGEERIHALTVWEVDLVGSPRNE